MSAADRQRLRRERLRKGIAVHPVEVDEDVYWALEIGGYLNSGESGDPAKVKAAISRAMADWAKDKISSRVTQLAGRRH